MNSNNTYPIDFVVTWLDSNEQRWQEEYLLYKNGTSEKEYTSMSRFRDWNLFRYWFRAVEEYAPWVNKVFLVTNGKFPDWINEDCPKLVLVKHSDYIPSEYLPTFNSHTIELFMNRIPGLSEHFVYFNDDFYLNAPVLPEYYFKEGLPCDCNAESLFNAPIYSKEDGFFTHIIKYTCVAVLNRHFNRSNTVKGSFKRWYGTHLGLLFWIMARLVSLHPYKRFIGFMDRHFEQPFLKSVLDEAWEKEPEMLSRSCCRFREDVNVSPYFFRYWQFATNKFYPSTLKHGAKYVLIPEEIPFILRDLYNKNVWSLCANDTTKCSEEDFERLKPIVEKAFAEKYSKISQYEK